MLHLLLLLTAVGIVAGAGAGADCEPLHSQSHGLNLVCCSLNETLTSNCEYSSVCSEHCSCHLTISRDVSCVAASNQIHIWRDHQPSRQPLPCSRPNLPNRNSKYSVVVEQAEPRIILELLRGMCDVNVFSLTLQMYDEELEKFDLPNCFKELRIFEIILMHRKKANLQPLLRYAKNLNTISLVNVDFEFWYQTSPFVHTLNFLHIENSTINELPRWMALSNSLTRLFIKHTRLQSLATISQLPRVKSLKLSHNGFDQLQRQLFISPLLVHVDLSFNRIESLASFTFTKSTDLRVLDLSHNLISLLPYKPFGKNTRLKWLKLSANNISSISADNFQGLSSLKTLSLSRNPLHSISPFAFLPLKSLKYLELEEANLTSIPNAVVYNCALTRLSLSNNLLHRSSSFPPEVMAMLSGLAQLKIDGNPLTEFPPSFLLISQENWKLLRQLLHSSMTLPVWGSEPCTPYYWAMHMKEKTTSLKSFLNEYGEAKMETNGMKHCLEQFTWMNEQMQVYRELEKTNGCAAQRRHRQALTRLTTSPPYTNTTPIRKIKALRDPIPQLFLVSLCSNFVLFSLIVLCLCATCCSSARKASYEEM